MARLSNVTQVLLLQAMGQHGRVGQAGDILSLVEESMTPDEYSVAEGFLSWALADWDHRSIGHGNIRDRWSEYQKKHQ